jgi:uncharacterized protein (DUF1800 family)
MARREQQIEHLLRRAGFGGSPAEVDAYSELGLSAAIDQLVNYDRITDDPDSHIGDPAYLGVTSHSTGAFNPRDTIDDARQRWLFRMVHSKRPLQEKMALFWHNHFATAYSKINGIYESSIATNMLASKPAEHPGGVRGQLELFRQFALGNFRDMLIQVAKDPAMLVWLDGRLNVKAQPQENFGREVMELFTFGVQNYTEQDVYAAARVFTGWNLHFVGANGSDPARRYEYIFNANQHETSAKTFSFQIYTDGTKTIPARAASEQDGIDLLNALAAHPGTGPRLARKLWNFFVSDLVTPPDAWVTRIANAYYSNNYEMRPVIHAILTSQEFQDSSAYFARYSWPAEFIARSVKEIGWAGFSIDNALSPMVNMNQQLFEPPDVAGWDLGQTWFTTGSSLSRTNFAATLTKNQAVNLRNAAKADVKNPQSLMAFVADRLSAAPIGIDVYNELINYLGANAKWNGSDTELQAKVAGGMHLVLGSAYYQFM